MAFMVYVNSYATPVNSNLNPMMVGTTGASSPNHRSQQSTRQYQASQEPTLAEKQHPKTKRVFKPLPITPTRHDVLANLKQANKTAQPSKSTNCHVDEGLRLVNEPNPPIRKITDILAKCDQTSPNDVQVLLLHGLLARHEGLTNKKFTPAINWFQKAVAVSTPDNKAPILELATTYEWSLQQNKAKNIYDQLLAKDPNLKPALIGSANVGIAQNRLQYSTAIYQKLLQKNPNDIDALNGLGRINLIENHYTKAKDFFKKVLQINPRNEDAKIGLEQLNKAQQSPPPGPISTTRTASMANSYVDEGFRLLNEPCPPMCEIMRILARCDQEAPNDVRVLLLHGLVARKQTVDKIQKDYIKKDYTVAICWLQRAVAVSPPDDNGPLLELATTYEWASQPERARVIYQNILIRDPNNRAAWLGLASVARAQYCFREAMCIYRNFLCRNPEDVDALVGVASVELANKNLACACKYYKTAQYIQPNNGDVAAGLKSLCCDAYRYTITASQARYAIDDTGTIPDSVDSYSSAVNFTADLNATDQVYLLLTHNTKEIQLANFTEPTFLPKNSILLGFQRQISERYGWGINYDYRDHVNETTEHHVEVNGNVYPCSRLQLYAGMRESFPTPFNYQLYWGGFTVFTDLPFNFSATAFNSVQEDPTQGVIHSPAYSFDLSKELSNKTYYDIGMAYLPTESKKWSAHANFVLPICKKQALVAWFEYYAFNESSYGGLGWRVYW